MEYEIRPEVMAFAAKMEEVLRLNDHKGGWSQLDPCWLFMRLQEEVEELRGLLTLAPGSTQAAYARDHDMIAREAADIANFAMMIADVCKPEGQ